MFIRSVNSKAVVSFTTKTGFIVTVGHVYKGDPVVLENGILVRKLEISKKYDYFIGISNFRKPSVLTLSELNVGNKVVIETPHGEYRAEVVEVLSRFKYRINQHVNIGDSGSPVHLAGDEGIIAYVTHTNVITSVIPAYKAIYQIMKELVEAKEPG